MFAPVTRIAGAAAPLALANIDTDVIIRIERLTQGDPSQIGRWAFEALRYGANGLENPGFILNQTAYRSATILVAGPNFGCGSSREAAVSALLALGFRCVIAERFGDIFYANCFQNGLLPIILPAAQTLELMDEARRMPATFIVDLSLQTIVTPSAQTIGFSIDAHRRAALLAGLDDIGQTLSEMAAIEAWQSADRITRPWVWERPNVEGPTHGR